MCIKEFISHVTLKFLHQSAICIRIPNWSKPIDEKQESISHEQNSTSSFLQKLAEQKEPIMENETSGIA